MAQPAMITIKIKCLKADDFELSINSEASVDDLKEEIVRLRNIEPTRQRLIFKGRVLKSDKKLTDYKISDETTVHLIIRKQPVTNPRNDEPTRENSTNNRNTSTIPTGTTAISVAVVDGTNGAADVNSILNSVLSGFSSGNLNQQSLQNSIQSAMNNNPAHVMNLRGLLNPGDNPNAPNDDDISSIDGDDNDDTTQSTTQPQPQSQSRRRGRGRGILPDLQPQFAVSNGRGGYSPVTLLPPVLRSCNAINLELDRLQRNYNRDALGINVDEKENKQQESGGGGDDNVTNQSSMSIDTTQQGNGNQNGSQMHIDRSDVEVEVQTIVADSNGNVLSNNVAPIPQPQPQPQSQGTQTQIQNVNVPQPQTPARSRREYLSNVLDTWDRFNEVVNGINPMDSIDDDNTENMDEDMDTIDDDEEMKGNDMSDMITQYKGVMGYIEVVFDELIDFQNTVESGLNNEMVEDENKRDENKENKEEKKCDEDNDMEMKGNDDENDVDVEEIVDDSNIDDSELKGYSKERKDKLKKKVKSAGNMLIEIGTVLASLGHMIDKMDVHRNTPRNRLRITGLSGISHVVRTAVPVEISTIVSRGINMGNLPQQFQQIRQMANINANTNANAGSNTNQNNNTAQSQPQPPPQRSAPQIVINNNSQIQQNGTSTSTSTNAPPVINGNTNTNTNTANASNSNNNNASASGSNLLSSLLDSFASTSNTNNNNATRNMEVDNENNTNNNSSVQNNRNNNNNNNNNAANPMGALLNAFSGGGGSNPLASLMSAFSGANRNRPQNSNNNDRNPLMLIQRTIKFIVDTFSMNELNEIRNGNYTIIGNYENILKSFILNTILNNNDTPMRRHEVAMDYSSGFGLFMISQFSGERREVIRSLTTNHFRNNTPLLIDIILDSNSDIIFQQKLIDWVKSVFSSWMYKLSLKYTNRVEGVKKLFGTILMNCIKYLYRSSNNNNILNNLQLIPRFVAYFVDIGKAYHLKTMAAVHGSQEDENRTNDIEMNNNNNKIKKIKKQIYGNEQWVMNVEESERNRWVDTIKCDQKRMKQCINEIKAHKFSQSYLMPSNEAKQNNKKRSSNDEEKHSQK